MVMNLIPSSPLPLSISPPSQMLSATIMHECIVRLLKSSSDEESLECFARLITTIGKYLDLPEAKVSLFKLCLFLYCRIIVYVVTLFYMFCFHFVFFITSFFDTHIHTHTHIQTNIHTYTWTHARAHTHRYELMAILVGCRTLFVRVRYRPRSSSCYRT